MVLLKLIRVKNLMIIALIQIVIKYTLINIFIDDFALTNFNFIIYLISLLSIVGGGYIINDIYDIETDKINKRNKNIIIGEIIKIPTCYKIYYILNITGIILGCYLAFSVNKPIFGLIFIFFTFSLYQYSKKYKKSFAIGNIQVGFLTALSILNIILFDLLPEVITQENGSHMIIRIIITYALFAFIITLIRELIKDLEDIEGDLYIEAKTIPITLGINKAKWIAISLTIITLLCIGYFQYFQYSIMNTKFEYDLSIWGVNKIAVVYVILIQILFTLSIYKIYNALKKNDFSIVSKLYKMIMIFGILAIPLFTYLHLN